MQVAIHTDTLNEAGFVDDTIAAIGGRTAPPKTSTPCQPTVQIPNENLSSRVGTYTSDVMIYLSSQYL